MYTKGGERRRDRVRCRPFFVGGKGRSREISGQSLHVVKSRLSQIHVCLALRKLEVYQCRPQLRALPWAGLICPFRAHWILPLIRNLFLPLPHPNPRLCTGGKAIPTAFLLLAPRFRCSRGAIVPRLLRGNPVEGRSYTRSRKFYILGHTRHWSAHDREGCQQKEGRAGKPAAIDKTTLPADRLGLKTPGG